MSRRRSRSRKPAGPTPAARGVRRRVWRRGALALAAVVVTIAAVLVARGVLQPERRAAAEARARDARVERAITQMCSTCHAPAQPEILPRGAWRLVVNGMYRTAERRGIPLPLSADAVAAWFAMHAPQRLPPAPGRVSAGPGVLEWSRGDWRPAAVGAAASPSVGHVRAVRLFGGDGLDLIVSEMATNRIHVLRPYLRDAEPVVIEGVTQPTRVTVTDLDRDGRLDLLAAGIGQMLPTNDPVGNVVWLRRVGAETFEPVVLLDSIGRVGDVVAADIDGSGRTDVAVAVFGWQQNGGLLWLENLGTTNGVPRFATHVLDERPGFTDVRVADLDGDGGLDIIALATQEFQQVMVYWREGGGFRPEAVYAAPHPDWGFVGLELVDFTGDGRTDIIVTNGDGLDVTVAKPQHGVGFLENRGGRRFDYHHLTYMYGAHRAEPVDLAGDGRIGLLISAYLPANLNYGRPDPPEAVIWLERVGATRLARRVLLAEDPALMTLTAGDMNGDGRTDFAAGWMDLGFADTAQAHRGAPLRQWASLWLNRGAVHPARPVPAEALIDWARKPKRAGR